MTLCEDGHQEVCFDGRNCPLCIILKEKDAEIDSLNDKVRELENAQE